MRDTHPLRICMSQPFGMSSMGRLILCPVGRPILCPVGNIRSDLLLLGFYGKWMNTVQIGRSGKRCLSRPCCLEFSVDSQLSIIMKDIEKNWLSARYIFIQNYKILFTIENKGFVEK